MTVINIDNLLETRKKFIIAEKEVEVIFNDETTKLITDVQLETSDLIKRFTDIEVLKEVDEKPLEDQKAYVNNLVVEMKSMCVNLFDSIIEQGEGSRIYEYYDGSTQALATIIKIIEDHNQVYKKQKYNEAKNKYRKAKNKKKR